MSKSIDQSETVLTSSCEGQVIGGYVWGEEVLLIILPHIRDMRSVTQECSVGFFVTKMEETRSVLLWVRLKVKKIIDLMRRGGWPFLEFVKDIECGQHPISIRGNLKRGHPEVISHPLEK